jgi:3-hydroxybutyryl-CoA dehydrogenase
MKNIVLAGGGVLGSQIAYQIAYKKFHVTIWLRSESSIQRTQPKLERLCTMYKQELESLRSQCGSESNLYSHGLVDNLKNLTPEKIDELKADADAALKNITLTTDLAAAVADADLVIECVAEQEDAKKEFYQQLAPLMPEKTIIASNSSSMLPSTFASYTGRPEKFSAMHFANEIWKNNTAEIMGHSGTAAATTDALVVFAKDIAMVPLKVLKEQPGYILNSMLIPLLMAAQSLVAEGVADAETVDLTWQLGTGAPMGPLHIVDLVGTATAYNITTTLPGGTDTATPNGRVAAMLKDMADAGKLGINAGEGYFKY